MQPERASKPPWFSSPATTLGVVLAIAVGSIFAPPAALQSIRNFWREVLRPGQQTLGNLAELAADGWKSMQPQTDAGSATAQQKISELNDRVQQLEMQLLAASSKRDFCSRDGDKDNADWQSGPTRLPPLLESQSVAARVLGRQAQTFLQARDILDVGRSRGIASQSLVVSQGDRQSAGTAKPPMGGDRAVIDEGRDAALESGRFVIAGSRVWGKIAEVGAHTSTVQRVTDIGYRDLVQLASPHDGKLRFAARGVLTGQGERLCKIEMVEITEPVAAGELVFTADDGVLDAPLLYGRVVKLQRQPGAAHWEIWMEPAVAAGSPPSQVVVLRMEVNSARLAGSNGEIPSNSIASQATRLK